MLRVNRRRASRRLDAVLRPGERVHLLIPGRYLDGPAFVAVTSSSLCVVPVDPAAGRGVQPSLGAIVASEIRPGVVWTAFRLETVAATLAFAVRPWHRSALEEKLAVARGEPCR